MKSIYHMTHWNNLPSILLKGGLLSDSLLMNQLTPLVNIAHNALKTRRQSIPVPVTPSGVLADYVPFYFANRSPMLYAISKGKVQGYSGPQDEIIYCVTTVETIAAARQTAWCFTDGHAVEKVTRFFTSLTDLGNIDWPVIANWSWKNTEADPDRKRRKQAEFLIHQYCDWNWILEIGVRTATAKSTVDQLLQEQKHPHHPPVNIYPSWYY